MYINFEAGKKSTITDMKNSLEECNSRFEQADVRIDELENRSVEMISLKNRKKMQNNEQSHETPIKHTDFWESGMGQKEYLFQEIIAQIPQI